MLIFIKCIVVPLPFTPTFSLLARNVLGVEIITEYLKIHRLSGLSQNLSSRTNKQKKWFQDQLPAEKRGQTNPKRMRDRFDRLTEEQAPPY